MKKNINIYIVGKTNVGKSSLFNLLIKDKKSIITNIEGTTRDIIEGQLEIQNKTFNLYDTGGLGYNDEFNIENYVKDNIKKNADLVLFTIDFQSELTIIDREIAKFLLKNNIKTIVVANKFDTEQQLNQNYELYSLGFNDICFISVLHRKNIDLLKNKIYNEMKNKKTTNKVQETTNNIKICIIGKPNVGKSSLFNKIVNQNKALVSDIPGTTRDALDTKIIYQKNDLIFIDTAGLFKNKKMHSEIFSKLSLNRFEKALYKSDIILFLVDIASEISHLDKTILGRAIKMKKSIIFIANKWDLEKNKKINYDKFIKYYNKHFPFISWVPILFVSAKADKNTNKILDLILEINKHRKQRISTSILNKRLQFWVTKNPPKTKGGHMIKFKYISQVESNPPVFMISVNNKKYMHFSYDRYIKNCIREEFGFLGTPIHIKFIETKKEK